MKRTRSAPGAPFESRIACRRLPGPESLRFATVKLEAIDLLHFDDEGRIKEMTVFFRPFPAIAAFLSTSGPKLARRRGSAGRVAILSAAGAPVSALMRTTAATGPRLLGLGRGNRSAG